MHDACSTAACRARSLSPHCCNAHHPPCAPSPPPPPECRRATRPRALPTLRLTASTSCSSLGRWELVVTSAEGPVAGVLLCGGGVQRQRCRHRKPLV